MRTDPLLENPASSSLDPHLENCNLIIRADTDGTPEIVCPQCMTSAALVHQEWVYTVRDVVHPKLQRVDDQAGTLWFITVSLDGSLEGESSLSSRSMAPFLCRSCGKGYGLPDDVHVTVPYSVVIDSISPGQIVEITH